MISIDTSVWIDHIRRSDRAVLDLVAGNGALLHPFALGEIALGSIKDRSRWLGTLGRVSPAPVATDARVLSLIDESDFHGSGIGYVDAHLLASAFLVENGKLWTRDKRLAAAADRLGIQAAIE